jgi:predicted MFS family arabinose efflux permease
LRAVVLALVPLAALLGLLNINLLFAVAVLAGSCGVVFDVAYVAWLPSVVERDELHDANGKMESTAAAAQAAGPGIAGLLIGIVSAPFTIAVDAVSFLVSALLIRSIRSRPQDNSNAVPRAHSVEGRPGGLRAVAFEIADGIQVVWRDAYLRAVVSCSAVVSLFGFVFLAVYVLFMTDVLGLSPAAIGLVLAAGGIGAVIGAATAVPLSRKMGFGTTMIWAQIVFAVTGITVPVAVYVPWLAVPMLALSEFTQYGAFAMYSVGAVSLRQARTPADRQGRASASVRTVVSGAALLGSVAGGVLGDRIGLGQTLVVGVVGMGLGCLLLIVSPLRRLRDLSAT